MSTELSAGDYVVHVRLNRNLNQNQANKVSSELASWDAKKMSKVWSQYARSKSIAANFDLKKWQTHLVVPLESYAGQDLLQIHTRNQEKGVEKRRTLQAKYASMRDVRPITQPAAVDAEKSGHGDEEDGADDESKPVEKDVDGSDDENKPAEGLANPITEEPTPTPPGPIQNALCDGCANGENIIGTRWKCMGCVDYDLCDRCHAAGIHDQHQMLKIEHPEDALAVEATVRFYPSRNKKI